MFWNAQCFENVVKIVMLHLMLKKKFENNVSKYK